MAYIKSPIHYMGNKYDLLPSMIEQFPKKEEVSVFYDIFGGGGTVSLNVPYDNVVYNELNGNMVNLLKMIKEEKPEDIITHIKKRIKEFDLNSEGTDTRQNITDNEEKRKYYNDRYLAFRKFYNESEKDIKDLYALSFWSFCNLMRFNSKNEFNMPYGNRCFIEDDALNLIQTHNVFLKKNITLLEGDAFELLKSLGNDKNIFFKMIVNSCDSEKANLTITISQYIIYILVLYISYPISWVLTAIALFIAVYITYKNLSKRDVKTQFNKV